MNFKTVNLEIHLASDMELLGKKIYESLKKTKNMIIFLSGDLGAGKTTFVRGFLRAMGYAGNVKSPTYTLVEPYELGEQTLYHFDFYRLANPNELETAGARDFFGHDALSLIEWPEKGQDYLPRPDLKIEIRITGSSRNVDIKALTSRGDNALQEFIYP